MIRFLLKGIRRDPNRSRLPIIIISIGVMLTVFLSGYIRGVMGDMIELTAKFQTGHLKVMTEAYAANQDQMPNDLAILDVEELMNELKTNYPNHQWVSRIKFGGLVDVPDKQGQTIAQGPCAGMAYDILQNEGNEVERMNLLNALVDGSMPQDNGEVLLSSSFAERLNIGIGDKVTFFGSTMNGSMTFKNFILSGTIKFGTKILDRGAMILDITDARALLDMDDATGEILGFANSGAYFDEIEDANAVRFNRAYANVEDEFKPVMFSLSEQNDMQSMLDYVDAMAAIFVAVFVFAMSLVLWNTGLLGGLRRYQEFGIRLALGESKGMIYRRLITEATIIGAIGSVVGTALGLFSCYMLQKYGIDISGMVPETTVMYPNVLRAKLSPDLYFIGFIPGVFSMVFGTMLAGLGVYKRQTAQLFKELEV